MELDTASERVAVVVLRLARGGALTTRQVSELTGLTRMGAWYLMSRIARVVPLANIDGRWFLVMGGKDGR